MAVIIYPRDESHSLVMVEDIVQVFFQKIVWMIVYLISQERA